MTENIPPRPTTEAPRKERISKSRHHTIQFGRHQSTINLGSSMIVPETSKSPTKKHKRPSFTTVQVQQEVNITESKGYHIFSILNELKKVKDITIPNDKELMMTASHQLLHSLSEYASFFIKSNIVKDSVNIRYHYLMNILLDDISSFVENVMMLYMSNGNMGLVNLQFLITHIQSIVVSLICVEASFSATMNQISRSTAHKSTMVGSRSTTSKSSEKNLSLSSHKSSSHLGRSSLSSDGSNYSVNEIYEYIKSYETVISERSDKWRVSVDNCRMDIEKKTFVVSDPKIQSDYKNYVSNMTKMMNEFFKREKSEPNIYTHCYSWMPILFKCNQIDFMGGMIHSIRSDDENKVLSAQHVISNWKNDPTATNNYFIHSMFDIFKEICELFKNNGTVVARNKLKEISTEKQAVKNVIHRLPPQFFFLTLNPRFMAQKLTEPIVNMFTKCPPRAIFYSKQMRLAGMKAADLKKKVDILAYWVSQTMYEAFKFKEFYQDVWEYFVEVILQLYWLRHNLLASLGISIGFSTFRLNRYPKPTLRKDLEAIKLWIYDLTDPKDGSYPLLIKAMKDLGNPCVPYFGSFQNIFEKVFSANVKDVRSLYLSIGKATEETRRNRTKWNDFSFEESSFIDSAFDVNFNEWCENPWSDHKLFDSMVKSNKFRPFHIAEDIPRRTKGINHLTKTKNGFKVSKSSVCRYMKYCPLLP